MNNIHLIAKIVDYNPIILYNMLCASKYINNELLENITVLYLENNTKVKDCHLNLIKKLKILDLKINKNITDKGLSFIPKIHTFDKLN